jgi:DNA-binding NtrC family response regulator
MSTPRPLQPQVLIADDEENIRFVLRQLLAAEGLAVAESPDGADAVEKIQKHRYPILIMDVRMPKLDGMAALKKIRDIAPETVIVMITAHGGDRMAMEAIQSGAYDFFTKPFDMMEVRVVVRRAMEKVRLTRRIREVEQSLSAQSQFDRIIGQSAPMQSVFELLRRVIDNDVSVLITGESGTGKELIAAAIHNNSARAKEAFIKVNTVAIPEALLESELFGHERGSFTGAVSQKIGKVEAASGGTLFLDEIGDMSLPLQAKLLRVLQEREIERIGSTRTIKVDIRVICATNRDLAKAVEKGEFREDLYYRINVLPVHLPPLRKRGDDIPALIDHFIQLYNARLKRNIQRVTPAALQRFLTYAWPGNIRELENTIQRTILMARNETIDVQDLPPTLAGQTSTASIAQSPDGSVEAPEALGDIDLGRLLDPQDFSCPLGDRLTQVNDAIERYLIKAALDKTGGHRQETADLLGMSRKSLHNKMVRYGMFADGEPDDASERGRKDRSAPTT